MQQIAEQSARLVTHRSQEPSSARVIPIFGSKWRQSESQKCRRRSGPLFAHSTRVTKLTGQAFRQYMQSSPQTSAYAHDSIKRTISIDRGEYRSRPRARSSVLKKYFDSSFRLI